MGGGARTEQKHVSGTKVSDTKLAPQHVLPKALTGHHDLGLEYESLEPP